MATPIKERGIKWVESYGDKSAYLKEEMDKQIGRSAYLRWEGHDHTTGNDYYVVISPGFSKKKGYFFFAGLRKMPADQGASGKKFKTQQEAISYAMEMWNVPRPKEKPAKAYNVADIQNKQIVLEPQHDGGSKKEASSIQRLIISEHLKSAMSMAVSAGTTSNFVPRYGEKAFPEMLAWAYRAQPVMGFMAALNTRKKMIGTDVVNVGNNARVQNKITGQDHSESPLAPLYATCSSPHRDEFKERTQGGHEDNPLIKIKRSGGKIVSYEPTKPMLDEDNENYTLFRWKDLRVVAKVSLPTNVFFSPQAKQAWSELGILARQNVRSPSEYKNIPQGAYNNQTGVPGIDFPKEVNDSGEKHKKNNIAVKFSLDPKLYMEFEKKMQGLVKSTPGHEHLSAKINIADQNQKNLIDLLKFHKETGKEFDWNTPCYEQMKASNTQLMVYDSLGFPLGMRMGVDNANSRVTQDSKEIADSSLPDVKKKSDRREATYVLRDAASLVAKSTSPISLHLGHKIMGIQALDAQVAAKEQELTKLRSTDVNVGGKEMELQQLTSQRDAAKAEVKQITDMVTGAWKRGDANALKTYALSLKDNPEVQKWATISEQDGKRRLDFASKTKEMKSRFLALKAEIKKKYLAGQDFTNEQNECKTIHKELEPVLAGFRMMSSHNMINVTHEDVADSRTCAPETTDVISDAFHVDQSGLPLDSQNKLADGQNGREAFGFRAAKKRYSPKAIARAKAEQGADGQQFFAARYFNPAEKWVDESGRQRVGRYVYDKLPANVQPSQDVTGLPIVIENPVMYIPDGKGGLRKITKSIWQKRDANSHGKFIPSGVFDVSMSPPEESARKSGKNIIGAGLSNDSFIATQEEHCARELDFITGKSKTPYSVRQLPPEPLFGYDPENAASQSFYSIKGSKGQEVDLSRFFEKRSDGYVHTNNTAALMELMKRQLGLDQSQIGSFTPLTSTGIRLIYEASAEGMHYHEAIDAFNNKDTNNPLYKDGEKFVAAGIDQKKYQYGKTCKESSTGSDIIHPEIAKTYQASIENPVEAFKASQGKVYVIQRTDATGQSSNAEDEDGTVFMFGSQMAAERALRMPYFEAQAKQASFKVAETSMTDMSTHIFGHQAPDGVATFGFNNIVTKVSQYKQGLTRDQIEGPREDKYNDQYAPTGDLGKTDAHVMQDADNVVKQMEAEGKTPEQIEAELKQHTQDPMVSDYLKKVYDQAGKMVAEKKPAAPQLDPSAMIPDISDQPEASTQVSVQNTVTTVAPVAPVAPPVQPQIPAAVPPPQAESNPIDIERAQKFFRNWVARGLTAEEMTQDAEAYSGYPMHAELMRLITEHGNKTPTMANGEQLGKLIALANKLDEEGRHTQADRIDRLVKVIMNGGKYAS